MNIAYFIHIEASHMCRFRLDCKGESYTKVSASLFNKKDKCIACAMIHYVSTSQLAVV